MEHEGDGNQMKNVPAGQERGARRREKREREGVREREWAFFSRGGRERG